MCITPVWALLENINTVILVKLYFHAFGISKNIIVNLSREWLYTLWPYLRMPAIHGAKTISGTFCLIILQPDSLSKRRFGCKIIKQNVPGFLVVLAPCIAGILNMYIISIYVLGSDEKHHQYINVRWKIIIIVTLVFSVAGVILTTYDLAKTIGKNCRSSKCFG